MILGKVGHLREAGYKNLNFVFFELFFGGLGRKFLLKMGEERIGFFP